MESRHEVVIPNEDLPFKMFIFEGRNGNYRVSRHWHPQVEIFLVVRGAMDFYINSSHFHLGEQQFVLVNSNEIHSIDCPDPNETIVLQIPVEAFDEYRREEPYISFGIRGEAQNQRLTALVRNMYQVYEARAYGYELKVKSLFYELLYLLVTEFRDENMDAGMIRQKQNLDRLSQVTRYMKEHYQEDLRLEEVASRFGFSATYLSRIFHKYAQVNYRTYLIDLRVKYAVRQLLNTDLEIEQIAIAHGFPDSRSFSKAFQKRYGCPPSRYRKQMKP